MEQTSRIPLAHGQHAPASNGPLSTPFLVKAGEPRAGEPLRFMGVHPNEIKISGSDTGGTLAMFEYTGLARIGPALHVHLQQDEIFYVVEGEYRFVVGNDTHVAKAGDTVFLPRKIAHTWIQLTERGKLIYIVTPANKLEEFFTRMNALRGVPTVEELNRIHDGYDMQVLGPPLTL